ncbi:hypothetical protein HID58_042769, partial [Brassica napus]
NAWPLNPLAWLRSKGLPKTWITSFLSLESENLKEGKHEFELTHLFPKRNMFKKTLDIAHVKVRNDRKFQIEHVRLCVKFKVNKNDVKAGN